MTGLDKLVKASYNLYTSSMEDRTPNKPYLTKVGDFQENNNVHQTKAQLGNYHLPILLWHQLGFVLPSVGECPN